MMFKRIKMFIAMTVVMVSLSMVLAQSENRVTSDVPPDGSREKQSSHRVDDIFALAKESVEDDSNIEFSGFYPGMSSQDADTLARHYKLRDGEYLFSALQGKVWSMWFSFKGLRRITNVGNTADELSEIVANRVGNMKHDLENDTYVRKTTDGVVARMSGAGFFLEREGRELHLAKLISGMISIPGTNFKMGKYEVTQELWILVTGTNPSKFKGRDRPVENVSWRDCKKFIATLNAMPEVMASGVRFRLPKEAEWEYACRAGATGAYCKLADETEITDSTLGEVAWYDDNSEEETHPVGQKKPNAFGLYDMHGNVWEWCDDLGLDGTLSCHVRRGGGWNVSSKDSTAGNRVICNPDSRVDFLGFRLVTSQVPNR